LFGLLSITDAGLRIAPPKEASLTFGLLSTTDAGLGITSPKEDSLTQHPFCDQAKENIQHILL
jgi:hypothetical protein